MRIAVTFVVLATLTVAGITVAAEKTTQAVAQPWVGVVTKDYVSSTSPRNGAVVESVEPDSPAARVGVEQGDVITMWAGKKVASKADLDRAVAEAAIGKRYQFGVVRNIEGAWKFGERPIVVAARPAEAQAAEQAPAQGKTTDERVIVLSVRDYAAVMKQIRSRRGNAMRDNIVPMALEMNEIGYPPRLRVIEVVDGSTALVDFHWYDESGGEFPVKRAILEGVPTKGQVDNDWWKSGSPPDGMYRSTVLKVVDTRKFQGTTYFVLHPVVQTDSDHPLPQ